jgi:hypothetical protein
MAISDWSSTAGSNTSIDGINIAEGCPSGNMNNAARAIMANVKAWTDAPVTYGTWTGAGYALSGVSNFYIAASGANPIINYDANDYHLYNQAANALTLTIGGATIATWTSTGLALNAAPLAVASGGTGATTQAAAFAALAVAASSLTQPGYLKLANGLIFQWGFVTTSASPTAQSAVSFPTAFPSTAFSILVNPNNNSPTATSAWVDSASASGFNLRCNIASVGCFWFAVGV